MKMCTAVLVSLVSVAASAQTEGMVGDYDVAFADSVDTMVLTADGFVHASSGTNGRWSFDANVLRLTWSEQQFDELDPVGGGRFVTRTRAFTLTRHAAPLDTRAVIGLFDGQHPRWKAPVTISPDGTFWISTGEGGRWTFNGSRLVLGWDRGEPDALTLTSAGTFVRQDGRFTLARRTANTPPPPVVVTAPPPPTTTPPPPPAPTVQVDETQAVGLFDVFNDQFADSVTFNANHTFAQGNGNTGTWAFDGKTLSVIFGNNGRQQFNFESPGRFVGAGRWFLIRRTAAPAPAPAPTLVSQPAMPYQPVRVVGETCPAGMGHVTPEEAVARQGQLCSLLGRWEIARLAGGGSMDGSGYSCGSRPSDTRGVGHSLCRPVVMVAVTPSPAPGPASLPVPAPNRVFKPFKVKGDTCVGGSPLSYEDAASRTAELCKMLDKWEIARVGSGSMDGSGYNCKLRREDTRKLGSALCRQ